MASYRTYSALDMTSKPYRIALRRAPIQGGGGDLGFKQLLGVSERQKPQKVGTKNILKGNKRL